MRTFLARLVLTAAGALALASGLSADPAGAAEGVTITPSVTCADGKMTVEVTVTRDAAQVVAVSYQHVTLNGGAWGMSTPTMTRSVDAPLLSPVRVWVTVDGVTEHATGWIHATETECGVVTPPLVGSASVDSQCLEGGAELGLTVTGEGDYRLRYVIDGQQEVDTVEVSGTQRFAKVIPHGSIVGFGVYDHFGRTVLGWDYLAVHPAAEGCTRPEQESAELVLVQACPEGTPVVTTTVVNTGDGGIDVELEVDIDGQVEVLPTLELAWGESFDADWAVAEGQSVRASLSGLGGSGGTKGGEEEVAVPQVAELVVEGCPAPQPPDGDTPPPVDPVARPVASAPRHPAVEVAGVDAAGRDTLPVTGVGSVASSVAGLALLGAGAALSRAGRRRAEVG